MSKYLFLICFLTSTAFAQDAYFYERYTKAWVKNGEEFDKQYPIGKNRSFKFPKGEKLMLYIPSKADLVEKNGEKYIKFYLINNTDQPIKLLRADATIASISTEIKVGDTWKIFQINEGSSCGNSYWTMDFFPKHYLSLELENRSSGDIKIQCRVKIKVGDSIITSNPTTIFLTKELLAMAGTLPKSVSL
jgi:hypothetical protein